MIDLTGEAIDSFTYAGGKLALKAGGSAVASLSFAGNYTKAGFQLTPDGAGGTDILFAASVEFPAGLATGALPFWAVRA